MTAPPPAGVVSGLRLDSLTGIRAVAAFLVFWHHAAGLYGAPSSGMVGVSLFYILSGFVMAWTDRQGDTAWLFYRRRFARIYPAYAVAVVLALILAALTRGISPYELIAFTLLQSWVPDEAIYFAASAVFWSLSCEAFFYLAFPVIRRVMRALSTQGLWLVAGGAFVVSLTIASIGSVFPVTPLLTWAVVVFPPSRLPEFVIGAVLGALFARGWRPRVPLALGWVLAAAGVGAAVVAPYALSRYAVTLVPFAVLIVALATADIRGSRVVTRSRVMVRLGEWSYAFYLIHLVVIMVVVPLGERLGLPLWASILLSLAGGVIAAWMLHRSVEKPGNALLRPPGRPLLDSD